MLVVVDHISWVDHILYHIFKNAFITEDLTPIRSKLLNYVKNHCKRKFVLCHTYNGRIRIKKSALEQGVLTDESKDEGTGNRIVISSPEDLFQSINQSTYFYLREKNKKHITNSNTKIK